MGWYKISGDDHESVYKKIAENMDQLIPSVIAAIVKKASESRQDLDKLKVSKQDVEEAFYSLDDSDEHSSLWEFIDKHPQYRKNKELLIDKIIFNQKKLLSEAKQKLESIIPIKPQQQPGGMGGMPPMGGGMPGMASGNTSIKISNIVKEAPFQSPKQEYYLMINHPDIWKKWYKEHGHHQDFTKYKKYRKKKSNYQLGSYVLDNVQRIGDIEIYDIVDIKNNESISKIAISGSNKKEIISAIARKILEG